MEGSPLPAFSRALAPTRTSLLLLIACSCLVAAPRGWANSVLAQRKASVPVNAAARFSLYPRATSDGSLKAAIKSAVRGIDELGLDVEADSVSSLLIGSQPTIFEAMQGVLGRAACLPGRPHVSMQCTISSDVPRSFEPPERTAASDSWNDAPQRVACQFNVYTLCELGSCLDSVVDLAAQSPSFVEEKPLCVSLDGDGAEVFRVLRECYELACGRSTSGQVVLTATFTSNLSKWKSAAEKATDAAELAASAVTE